MKNKQALIKNIYPGTYRIRETGGEYDATVNRLFADGSTLDAPQNAHLLATITKIIDAEYPVKPVNTEQAGTSVTIIVSSFAMLTQWMKCRGIHFFAHLTTKDYQDFISDSAKGVEYALKAPKRVHAVLEEISASLVLRKEPWSAERILERACIQPTLRTKLPQSMALIRDFLENGNNLSDLIPTVIPEKRLTQGVLWGRARVFSLLWNHREMLKDTISFEPSMSTTNDLIKQHGREEGSTRTLPVPAICKLIAAAFQWVYEIGPELANVQAQMLSLERNENDGASRFELCEEFNVVAANRGWSIRITTSAVHWPVSGARLWFSAAQTLLPAACLVVGSRMIGFLKKSVPCS